MTCDSTGWSVSPFQGCLQCPHALTYYRVAVVSLSLRGLCHTRTVCGQPPHPMPLCLCPHSATPTQPCPFSLPTQTLSLASASSEDAMSPPHCPQPRAGPGRLVSPVTHRHPDHPAPRGAPLEAGSAVGLGDTDLSALRDHQCHHLVQGWGGTGGRRDMTTSLSLREAPHV